MSMSDFISGGAGCGPSNPLQSIGKRLGQDRGAQHDSFAQAPGQPQFRHQNPSFRSSNASSSSQQQQPSFFAAPSQHQSVVPTNPVENAFDVSQLRGNLPPASQFSLHHHHSPGPSMADMENSFRPSFPGGQIASTARPPVTANAAWASDFLKLDSPLASSSVQQRHLGGQYSQMQNEHHLTYSQSVMPMRHPMSTHLPVMQFSPQAMPGYAPQDLSQASRESAVAVPPSHADQVEWAEAFTAFDKSSDRDSISRQSALPAERTEAKTQQSVDCNDPTERDELARTAGRLVSSVEHDQSVKFRQSNFLDLMRKIRDKRAGIQGTDIVEQSESQFTTSEKAKGKANEVSSEASSSSHFQNQQEAYSWANQMASSGQLHRLPPSLQKSMGAQRGSQSMVPPVLNSDQEIANRQAINDLWAEEDARSEAIERQAMQESARNFVGDAGDVAARMREDDAEAREFAKYQRLGANIPHAAAFNSRWEEDMNRSAGQEEEEEHDFVGRRWEGVKGRGYPGAQTAEWDKLQNDWDNFEVTSAGIRPVQRTEAATSAKTSTTPTYRFLSDNPYIVSTRQHASHTGGIPAGLESVLEKEAAVQQDPQNASAWYDLGVKQQENEREVQAIAALQKALQLDPKLKDAWLALAVSYTNENDRSAAYDAIEKWVEMNDKYKEATTKAELDLANQARERTRSDSVSSHSTSSSIFEKHSRLTNLLIAMARYGGERGEVDADVQVALGVIFNSSEDYDKAVDCFSTALSVRPTDWLLYNRLGATLSNSGRSAEAIAYYHHALDLQPEFVRCHFNLSISCLNLKMYQDAAEHIYTALTLQQAEAETLEMVSTPGDPNRPSSATSGSLWETFRVALELLNRSDLAAKCSLRDINAFDPNDLVGPVPNPNVHGSSSLDGSNAGAHLDQDMSDY